MRLGQVARVRLLVKGAKAIKQALGFFMPGTDGHIASQSEVDRTFG